jgi:hypothetical protein
LGKEETTRYFSHRWTLINKWKKEHKERRYLDADYADYADKKRGKFLILASRSLFLTMNNEL